MDEETGAQSHEVTVTCPKSQRRSARGGVRPRRPDFRAVCCALCLAATGRERGLATRPGSQGTHGAEGCAEGGVGGKRRESGLPPPAPAPAPCVLHAPCGFPYALTGTMSSSSGGQQINSTQTMTSQAEVY